MKEPPLSEDPSATGIREIVELLVAGFEERFARGERPKVEAELGELNGVVRDKALRELIHVDLELRLRSGETARVEQYLSRFPELSADKLLIRDLLRVEAEQRRRRHCSPTVHELEARFPEIDAADVMPSGDLPALPLVYPVRLNCPQCQEPLSGGAGQTESSILCPACGAAVELHRDQNLTWESKKLPRLGKFELLEAVGRGAFGTVYRARDRELDRIVAVKVPRSGSFSGAEDEERFVREARSTARLNHPGVVPVYDVGRTREFPYIVSEFVDGITLDDAISQRRLALREAAELIAEIALTLDFVHRNGVIHRDLKPSNIILQPSDKTERDSDSSRRSPRFRMSDQGSTTNRMIPRLMDFGLARLDHADATLTTENQILGTPAWMSPEQAEGSGHQADGRSDLYSLGVILYQLIAGDLPFRGNPRMVRFQVLNDEPVPPRRLNDAIPADLETICLKAMSRQPARRYQTGAELSDDLSRFLNGEPILARPVGVLERAWRFCRRNAVVSSLTALVMVSLIAGTVVSSWFAVQAAKARNRSDVLLKLNELRTRLQNSSFDEPEVASLMADAQTLGRLSPESGVEATALIAASFANRLKSDIRQLTSASEESVRQIRSGIDQLQRLNPALAAEVRVFEADSVRLPVQLIDVPSAIHGVFADGACLVRPSAGGDVMVRGFPAPPDSLPVVPTLVSATENERCEMEFDFPSGGAAGPVGLAVGYRPGPAGEPDQLDGYLFLIRPSGGSAPGDPGQPVLSIWRGRSLLREQRLDLSKSAGPCRLSASRSGDEVSVRVNMNDPLVFHDLLALPPSTVGTFALIWPDQVAIRSFRAWGTRHSGDDTRQPAMLRGHRAFAESRWNEALSAYQAAERELEDPELRQEARFRQGLCLLQTEPEPAGRLLRSVTADESVADSRWPLVAACQWWQYLLRNNRLDEADEVLAFLTSRNSEQQPAFEDLTAILPVSIRQSIVESYLNAGALGGYDSVRPHPERVRNMERLQSLWTLIQVPEETRVDSRRALARAYMEVGRITEAREQMTQSLASPMWNDPKYAENWLHAMEYYVWCQLLLNNESATLEQLDRLELPFTPGPGTPYGHLHTLKALVLQRVGRSEEALTELQKAIADETPGELTSMFRLEALLVAGFVSEHLGRHAEAVTYWQRGKQLVLDRDLFRAASLHASLLCSLSESMTPDDTDRVVAAVATMMEENGMSSTVINFVKNGFLDRSLLHGVLSNLWSCPRGRVLARQISLLEIDFDRANYAQVLLCGYLCWRRCLSGDWHTTDSLTEAQELLVWTLCEEAFQAFRRDELTEQQVAFLGMAYVGVPNLWNQARETVPAGIRGPIDYLNGCLYRRQYLRNEEARGFLQNALLDAETSANGTLKELIQSELQTLPPSESQ